MWYYDVAVVDMPLRNASPRRHMCFRGLMFSLSVPCECNVISLHFLWCSVYLCCVFDNVCELFELIRNMFVCGVLLLLNVMEVLVFQRMCDPSVYLDVPSIGLVYVCVCRK